MGESINKQIARAFIDALSRGDVDAMAQVITQDIVADAKGTSVVSMKGDHAGVLEAVAGISASTKGGIAFDIVALTEEDDRVVCEVQGASELVTGQPYNNEYAFVFTLRDGKVCGIREYFDTKLAEETMGPLLAAQ